MKTVVMNLKEMMEAKGALDALLALAGIPHKKAYWLDRNRKALMPSMKTWYATAQAVAEKYAEVIPSFPFIPAESYYSFKKEMEALFGGEGATEEMIPIFTKYEKLSDSAGKKGVPMENRALYEAEINEAAEKFSIDIDIYPVDLNPDLEAVLQKLSGDEQIALSFIFEGESTIKVFPGSKIIA